MGIESILKEKPHIITIQKGMSTYIKREYAEEVITLCKVCGVAILGFEGLFCGKRYTKPDLGLIANFSMTKQKLSWEDYQRKSIIYSEKVIKKFPQAEDLYVDFVIVSKDEFERP